MSKVYETGHDKNVANLEDLISACATYGAAYNPSNATIKMAAMTTLLTSAQAALKAVTTAKANYNAATNAREVAFEPLRKLSTRVVSAFAASGTTEQNLADAKTLLRKLNGRRAGTGPDTAAAKTGEDVNSISASQQSYDSLMESFSALIATVSIEPKYAPNEADMKVTALNAHLATLKSLNTAAITATMALANARTQRNNLLYTKTTGLLDVVQNSKVYLKSVYGASAPQYRKVSALKFQDLSN